MHRAGIFVLSFLSLVQPVRATTTTVFESSSQGQPIYGRLASARTAALGGAFHALVQGKDALFGNPAGLAAVDVTELGVHHESWLADINQETGYAVMPAGRGWGLGLYGHVVDYGSFEVRDTSGQKLGSMTARDYAVGMGLGVQTRNGFQAGITARGMRENLVSEDNFTFALDAGLAWAAKGGWQGGIAAFNVGASSNGSSGAESVRWSFGRRIDWNLGWVMPVLGFSWEPKGIPRMHLGTEVRLNPMLDLRMGYQHRFVQTLTDGMQGVTLGLGFRLGQIGLDYAFLPFGDLGAGHRVSLAWRLDAVGDAQVVEKAPVLQRPQELVPPALPVITPTPAPTPLQYQEDPLAHAKELEAQGRHGEALAAYEHEAQEHPDLLGAWRGIADISYRLGDKARALLAFEKVLELKPDPDLAEWVEQFRRE